MEHRAHCRHQRDRGAQPRDQPHHPRGEAQPGREGERDQHQPSENDVHHSNDCGRDDGGHCDDDDDDDDADAYENDDNEDADANDDDVDNDDDDDDDDDNDNDHVIDSDVG